MARGVEVGPDAAARRLPQMCQKTKICRYHMWGVCTRGADCAFAHGEEELRAVPDLKCTKPCPALILTGVCQDPRCAFAHHKDELRRFPAAQSRARDTTAHRAFDSAAAYAPEGGWGSGSDGSPDDRSISTRASETEVAGGVGGSASPLSWAHIGPGPPGYSDGPLFRAGAPVPPAPWASPYGMTAGGSLPAQGAPRPARGLGFFEAQQDGPLQAPPGVAGAAAGQQAEDGEEQREAAPRSKFQKTKMCTFFLSGKCKKRHRCTFAHCEEEIRPLPDLRCTKMCPAILEGQPCTTEDCMYAHREEDLRPELRDVTKAAATEVVPPPGCEPQQQPEASGTSEQDAPAASRPSAPEPEEVSDSDSEGINDDQFELGSDSGDEFETPAHCWRRQRTEDPVALRVRAMRVKNTFITIEEEEDEDNADNKPRKGRSRSAPAIFRMDRSDGPKSRQSTCTARANSRQSTVGPQSRQTTVQVSPILEGMLPQRPPQMPEPSMPPPRPCRKVMEECLPTLEAPRLSADVGRQAAQAAASAYREQTSLGEPLFIQPSWGRGLPSMSSLPVLAPMLGVQQASTASVPSMESLAAMSQALGTQARLPDAVRMQMKQQSLSPKFQGYPSSPMAHQQQFGHVSPVYTMMAQPLPHSMLQGTFLMPMER